MKRSLRHLLDDLAWHAVIVLRRDQGGIRWGQR